MIPSIPSVPTDNLYKFLSLAGLAVFAFFFWYSWQAPIHLVDEERQARMSMAALIGDIQVEINGLDDSERKLLTDVINHWPTPGHLLINKSSDQDKYSRYIKEWDDFMLCILQSPSHELSPAFRRYRERLRDHSSSVQLLWARLYFQLEARNYALVISVFGFFMSILGFYLWYSRFQQFQDKLLMLQLEKESRTLASRRPDF